MAVLPIPVFCLPGRLAIIITTLFGRRCLRLGVLWIVSHHSTSLKFARFSSGYGGEMHAQFAQLC